MTGVDLLGELICLHKMVRLYPNVASCNRWSEEHSYILAVEKAQIFGDETTFSHGSFVHVSIHTC